MHIFLTYTLGLLLLFSLSGSAQLPHIGIPTPPVPQFNNIPPSAVNQPAANSQRLVTAQLINETNNFQSKEQRRIQVNEILQDAFEENRYPLVGSGRYNVTRSYWEALSKLESMAGLPDSLFSITEAVFIVENAYFDKRLQWDKFNQMLKFRGQLCRNIIRKEKLDSTDNLAKNYAIQRVFTDTITYTDQKTHQQRKIQPLKYDFEDYKGEQHWENMFVSKLLLTGRGQCHSMPLLYLMLAEELEARAFLSTAPEHSYIQFPGRSGKNYNFETTSGILVSNNWLMQSGFINTTAIKQGTYMDTLGHRKLMAYIVMDLTMGYMQKYGFDTFVLNAMKVAKSLDPNNLNMLLMDANITTYRALGMIKAVGSPPPDKLTKYPAVYAEYQRMQSLYDQIDNLGFQSMPKEAYQAWLKSVEKEKEKQLKKDIQVQLQSQINKTIISQKLKN